MFLNLKQGGYNLRIITLVSGKRRNIGVPIPTHFPNLKIWMLGVNRVLWTFWNQYLAWSHVFRKSQRLWSDAYTKAERGFQSHQNRIIRALKTSILRRKVGSKGSTFDHHISSVFSRNIIKMMFFNTLLALSINVSLFLEKRSALYWWVVCQNECFHGVLSMHRKTSKMNQNMQAVAT